MSPRRLVFGFLFLASLALVLDNRPVRGQAGDHLGNGPDLEKAFRAIDSGKLRVYILGSEPPSDANVLDTTAKYYVYRFTWPQTENLKPDGLQTAVKEFGDHIERINKNRKDNTAFVNAYSPALVARFGQLTDLSVVENSRTLLIGLQTFPHLGKLKHDAIGKYFVQLIDPKTGKHDVIKLWALRGLREFFPIEKPWVDPIEGAEFQNKNRLARKAIDLERLDVVTQFMHRPAPLSGSFEELAAYQYLRREAIETLAQAGVPAVSAVKKIGTVEGDVARTLLSVLVPKVLTPEPNLAEKVEAALGLCQMMPIDEYNASPSVYFIGKTLLEFAAEYRKDFGNIALGEKRPLPTQFPWKIMAKRWELALKDLAKTTTAKDRQAQDRAKLLDAEGRRIVTDPISNKAPQPVNDLLQLERLIAKMAPGPEPLKLYKNVKSAPLTWNAAE